MRRPERKKVHIRNQGGAVSEEVIFGLLIGAVIGVWIYAIGTAIALIITSEWFLNTWAGKAIAEAWELIAKSIRTILPPYKR